MLVGAEILISHYKLCVFACPRPRRVAALRKIFIARR